MARSERLWKPTRDMVLEVQNWNPSLHSQLNTAHLETQPEQSTFCLVPARRPKAYLAFLFPPPRPQPLHPLALSGAQNTALRSLILSPPEGGSGCHLQSPPTPDLPHSARPWVLFWRAPIFTSMRFKLSFIN